MEIKRICERDLAFIVVNADVALIFLLIGNKYGEYYY